jgi:Mg/Co/Ni transporter MgtE
MDPLVVTAPLSASVAEARALIASHVAHLYYYIYVLDSGHRLAGVVDIAELFQAEPEQPLRTVMQTNLVWLEAESSFDAVFAHPGWCLYDALPVVGPDRRFLGVIRHRRMRQLLETHAPATPGDPGIRTMLALGEFYWLGLCGLLQGLGATAVESSERREAE